MIHENPAEREGWGKQFHPITEYTLKNKKNKKKMLLDKNRNFHFMIQNFSANLNAEDPTVKSDYMKIIKILILSLLAV